MITSPLSITRRHVLGDFYSRCESIVSIPVYLETVGGEMLGYADEGLGHYADAFCFHLAEDVCKKLSAGHFTYSFDFDYCREAGIPERRQRIKLNSIVLVMRKGYAKPIPRSAKANAAVEAAAELAEEVATADIQS
jgi:hypothetical protein